MVYPNDKEYLMIEILSVIAMLCQINPGETVQAVEKAQIRCQKYYVRCVDRERETSSSSEALKKCILKRDV